VPRTVVYDDPIAQARLVEDDPGRRKTPTAAARRKVDRKTEPATEAEKVQAAQLPVKDDYTSKIAKYVPAEVVAVSVAGFAAFNPTGRWIWGGIALGIGANLLYLGGNAVRLDPVSRPRWFFYILSGVAFLAWALATIPQVRRKFDLAGTENDQKAAYILAAAAFGLPLLDTLGNSIEIQLRKDSG
jgi:hypothetical protein